MILHTINKSPTTHTCFDNCLDVAGVGNGFILLENGVYAAVDGTPAASRIKQVDGRFFALREDVSARGLNHQLLEGIEIIDYAQFVELATQYAAVQSWY